MSQNPEAELDTTSGGGSTANRLPMRRCVGIMLLNEAGKVWIGKRITKPHDNHDGHIWQMPQGGIDENEDALTAAYRELEEETGITSVELLGTAGELFSYELPEEIQGKALKGKYRGQIQQWYAMRFTGDESEINIDEKPTQKAEFSDWKWENAAELPGLIIPFKRRVYEQVIEEFNGLL